MDKKVYYGEYSLKHWIELLLKKDLELPPYQRNFVWLEEQVKEFVNGLKGEIFVPPVTIGVCNKDGVNHNLILDGQQRLSSILLAFFGVYPKKDAFPRDEDERVMADGVAEEDNGLSGNFWLVSFKISYLCLPLFYETRTTPSCHPSGCAYRQL